MEGKEEGQESNAPVQEKAFNSAYELHVKGQLFEATEDQVIEHFNTFGKVESLNLLKGPYGSKGIAFVRMQDENGLNEALKHTGEEFMGRKVWIEKSKTREERNMNNNNDYNFNKNNYNNYNNNYNRNYNNYNNNYNNYNQNQNYNQNEVVVKGLPFECNEDDVWRHFENFGQLRSQNLLKRPDGTSKGICFVRYVNRGGLFKAEDHNGQEFMGRKIWIKNSNPKYQNNNYNYNKGYNNNYNNNNFNNNNNFTKKVHVNQSKTIFVGNLNWSTDSETLSKVFEPCGKVADVRIGRKPDGRSRGFAYVEFETEEAAEKALAMKGTMVNEREINIDQSFYIFYLLF